MDKGLNLRDIEGLFDTAGEFVDIVKLGWGTSYITNNLEKKIALYRSFETPVVCGGTLFEAVYARDRIDEFKLWLAEHRFSHVEISDGTIEIPRERKLELIADFARDFTVLSEVGLKGRGRGLRAVPVGRLDQGGLAAGAWKVITEGREGGTAGIFRPDGDMRTGLLDEIAHEISVEEPPLRGADEVVAGLVRAASSAPNVNLGNIPPDEVIAVETLRLGLRADTLKEILLGATPTKWTDGGWTGSSPSPGSLVGLLVGVTGMGGGSLMTPLLVLFFGFKPSIAIGTDIVHGAIFKSFGAVQHRRLGTCARPAHRLDAARLGAVLDRRRLAALVAQARVRGRVRGQRRRRSSEWRSSSAGPGVPRQGVPALRAGGQALHPRAARPGDRGRGRGRRWLRRRPHLGRQRHAVRAGDADRVPAHRGEDRRHGHLPRRAILLAVAGAGHLLVGHVDLAATGWLLIGSVPGVLIGGRFTARPARPGAPDRARRDADPRRREARRPPRRGRDRALGWRLRQVSQPLVVAGRWLPGPERRPGREERERMPPARAACGRRSSAAS